jgi:hypothetical protein
MVILPAAETCVSPAGGIAAVAGSFRTKLDQKVIRAAWVHRCNPNAVWLSNN